MIIGIDEVGRGPVAGPVAVGAFLLKGKLPLKQVSIPLRDSKKLSRQQREVWYSHIQEWQKEGLCDFYVCMISAAYIDRDGIAPSIRKALATSLSKISDDVSIQILLDGGLKAPVAYKKQKTIIKGDEKEPAISLASIAAKVTRDRYMLRQHVKFPQYGFDAHVGYGTKNHYAAIKKHGQTVLHRKSFLKSL